MQTYSPHLCARSCRCMTLIFGKCARHVAFVLVCSRTGLAFRPFSPQRGASPRSRPRALSSPRPTAQAPCRKEARLELALHRSFSWIHGHCCVQYQMALRASHLVPSAVSLAVSALRKVRQLPTPKQLSRTHRVWCADMPDRSVSCRTGCKYWHCSCSKGARTALLPTLP